MSTHSPPIAGLPSQFGFPRGALGRLVGRVMALENRRANTLIVDELAVRPEDFVLELGCGPGVAVNSASRVAAYTVGVDPSTAMVAQARRRCRAAIQAGRAEITEASADWLPYDGGFFTCAFALHTMHHWPCVPAGLRELHRVLEPGGRILLADRLERRGRDPHARGMNAKDAEAIGRALSDAGFSRVERSEHDLGRELLAVFRASA